MARRQQQLPGQAFRNGALMLEQVENAVLEVIWIMTEIAGHRTVGIQIERHDTLARIGQQTGERDGRGGFAHSTFLIGYCPDSHNSLPSGSNQTGNCRAELAGDGDLTTPHAAPIERELVQVVCQIARQLRQPGHWHCRRRSRCGAHRDFAK